MKVSLLRGEEKAFLVEVIACVKLSWLEGACSMKELKEVLGEGSREGTIGGR